MENHIKQKEEGQRLEEEIKQRGAGLQSTNVEIQIIQEYKQLKSELNKHHLSCEDPSRLLAVLRNIKRCGYDPNKIAAEFSKIKSLKQRDKILQENCKMFDERIARCQSVLLLCEQIIRLKIGIGELLAFHTAVSEKAQMHNFHYLSVALAAALDAAFESDYIAFFVFSKYVILIAKFPKPIELRFSDGIIRDRS